MLAPEYAISTKQDLIDAISKRVEDKIMEANTAELLIKLINNASDLKEAISISALGTMSKRTGFNFDVRLDVGNHDTIKYFKKNEKLSFSDGSDKPVNKLIIGDNYDALQNLLIQYRGKIDVIYIDPPYSANKMGEFAKTNYTNSLSRDNLLSMLYSRVLIAKQLLSDDGIFMCSIDDRNQSYVKCMLDEIFDEFGFITSFVWQKKKGGGEAKFVYEVHEYILCYIKNKKLVENLLINDEAKISKNNILEKDGKIYRINAGFLRAVFGKYNAGEERRCHYEDIEKIKGKDKLEEVDEKIKSGEYILRQSNSDLNKHYVCKLEDITEGKKKIVYSIISGIRTEDGNTEIENIGLLFDDPKPVELIKILLNLTQKKEAIILDFFAGSGTTGQATLELNEIDGNRQFILCTNNEITDDQPNGIAIDVTTKRLKRVMTGKCYDNTNDFKWIKENKALGGSLDVYEIEKVANNNLAEGETAFDLIDETLYGQKKFDKKIDKIKWLCENFEITEGELEKDKEYMERVKRGGI